MIQNKYAEVALEIMQNDSEKRRYIAKTNFACFCMFYFTSYFKTPNAPFHYQIMQSLEDLQDNKINELLIIGFRSSAKTTLMQLWIIWLIIFDKRKYINVDSYDGENAERTLYEVAQLLATNDKIIKDYGMFYYRDVSKFTKTQNKVIS